MALYDYRQCDVCECKVFYDSVLNYDFGEENPENLARINGKDGMHCLEFLGDWAVICRDCAKTHKTIVTPK